MYDIGTTYPLQTCPSHNLPLPSHLVPSRVIVLVLRQALEHPYFLQAPLPADPAKLNIRKRALKKR